MWRGVKFVGLDYLDCLFCDFWCLLCVVVSFVFVTFAYKMPEWKMLLGGDAVMLSMLMLLVRLLFLAMVLVWSVLGGAGWRCSGAATDSPVILQAGSYVLFLVVLMFVMLCGCIVGVDCVLL